MARLPARLALCVLAAIGLASAAQHASTSITPVSAVTRSNATIKIATTLALTGQFATVGPALKQGYDLCTELANKRGGVTVNDVQYNLTLVSATDDSSAGYQQSLYDGWGQQASINLFFAPHNSPNGAILANAKYNKTMLSPNARSANYYRPGGALVGNQALTDENAHKVIEMIASSPQGLKQIALFSRPEAFSMSTYNAIKALANATGIEIVHDQILDYVSGSDDQDEYIEALASLPPKYHSVDMLIICSSVTDDFLLVVRALATTRLTPKSAVFTNAFLETNAEVMAQGQHWMTGMGWHPSSTSQASFPGVLWANNSQFITSFRAKYGKDPVFVSANGACACELYLAALRNAASISTEDVLLSLKAMNGSTFYSPFKLHPTLQYNVAQSFLPYQVRNGKAVQVDAKSMIYPAPWPWAQLAAGDAVDHAQAGDQIILAIVLMCLGSWVGVILAEQTVYSKKKSPRSWRHIGWMLATVVALGISSVWCSNFVLILALSFVAPANSDIDFTISYAIGVAMCALLPAVCCMFIGLWFIMADVNRISSAKHLVYDVMSADGQQDVEDEDNKSSLAAAESKRMKVEMSKLLATSWSAHTKHLYLHTTWRVLLGSAFVTVGICLCRAVMFESLVSNIDLNQNVGAAIGSGFLTFVLVSCAMLGFFHAVRVRALFAFLFAAAVIIEWQINVLSSEFAYAPGTVHTPVALYKYLVGRSEIGLAMAAISAITAFSFIGLQFQTMKLSRNSLSTLVTSLELRIAKMDRQLLSVQARTRYWHHVAEDLTHCLEMIQLLRPMPRDYSFALAQHCNVSNAEFIRHISTQAASNATDPHLKDRPVARTAAPGGKSTMRTNHSDAERDTAILSQLNIEQIPAKLIPKSRVNSSSQLHSHTTLVTSPSAVVVAIVGGVGCGSSALRPYGLALQQSVRESLRHASVSVPDNSHPEGLQHQLSVNSLTLLDEQETNTTTHTAHDALVSNGDTPPAAAAAGQQQTTATTSTNSPLHTTVRIVATRRSASNSHASPKNAAELASIAALARRNSLDLLPNTVKDEERHADFSPSNLRKSKLQANALNSVATSQVTPVANSLTGTDAHGAPTTVVASRRISNPIVTSPSIHTSSPSHPMSPSSVPRSQSFMIKNSGNTLQLLMQLVSHPVCVEILKDELLKLHSLEGLMFYIDVSRYKTIKSTKLRIAIGKQLFQTYIPSNSELQVNVSSSLREKIERRLADSATNDEYKYSVDLFDLIEREVLSLIDVNLMKSFVASPAYKMCISILANSSPNSIDAPPAQVLHSSD